MIFDNGSEIPSAAAPDTRSSDEVDPPRHVVAISASAGGVDALQRLVGALPSDFSAAVLIVLHIPSHRESHLAKILQRCTTLRVVEAKFGGRICPGTVYVAPPDHHLELGPDRVIQLSTGPKVHFSRPSADPLFASVARQCGGGSILVILTGFGRNGSTALSEAKRQGSYVIAQDRESSLHFAMPLAAIGTGCVDEILPLEKIAPRLVELCREQGTEPYGGQENDQ